MPRFEVFCPASPPSLPADVTFRVDAEHWLAALTAGLQRTGGGRPAAHVLCDVQADGWIHVTAPQGGGVFRIRELRDAAPAAAVPPPAPRAAPGPVAPASAPARAVSGLPALDRQAGLERLLDVAMERVGAEAGSVLLTRPGGLELEFAVVRGPRAQKLAALRATVPVGSGVVGYCVREGVALAVSDPRRDPRFLWAISLAIDYETRSILCAPVTREGQVVGALEVLNKRGGAPFDARDVAALSDLAREAGEHLARYGG